MMIFHEPKTINQYRTDIFENPQAGTLPLATRLPILFTGHA